MTIEGALVRLAEYIDIDAATAAKIEVGMNLRVTDYGERYTFGAARKRKLKNGMVRIYAGPVTVHPEPTP